MTDHRSPRPSHARPGRRHTRVTAAATLVAAAVLGWTLTNGAPEAVVAKPPVAGARVVSMTESPPERLRIPSIGVDTKLIDLGLDKDGSLEVPPKAEPAGWFTGSPTPGELGPAVIAAHVAWNGKRGTFSELDELEENGTILVDREDGSTATFRVSRSLTVPKGEFPTEDVYGNIDHAGLRLITCADFDDRTGKYADNLVVFAALVAAG